MKNRLMKQILFAFVVFFLICFFYKGSGYTAQYDALVSIATFIFGIYLAFSIYNNQTKLSKIKELLRNDDANILALHRLSRNFSEAHSQNARKLIDDYLIEQIDYKLQDYNRSTPTFLRLYDYIADLNPKTEKESVTYREMLVLIDTVSSNRTLVTTLVGQKITYLEWLSIYTLLGLIDLFIIIFNSGAFASSILSAILATTGFTLVLVLRELDSLRWQEDQWVWNQLHDLFINLDLTPYYPEDVIKQGRAVVPANSHIRLAHYPNPYPDVKEKTVKSVVTK